jgi:hypothetical protein
MSAPLSEGGPKWRPEAARRAPLSRVVARAEQLDDNEAWIAVLEFARPDDGRAFLAGDFQELMDRLHRWQSSGLWHPDRYAVHLRLSAGHPDEALEWALAYHGDAARAAGLPLSRLVRVEIMTVSEFERQLDEDDPEDQDPPSTSDAWVLDEVYETTRRLLAAATASELSDSIAGFLTAIGATVESGVPGDRPGVIDVDITIAGQELRHACADRLSVTALVIERSLPSLLGDAHRMLARLEARAGPAGFDGQGAVGREEHESAGP